MKKHSIEFCKKWLQRNYLTVHDIQLALHRFNGKYNGSDYEVLEAMQYYTTTELKYMTSIQ